MPHNTRLVLKIAGEGWPHVGFVLRSIMERFPAAVIFDMDGLLFDSEALYRDAIIEAAKELGHSFTIDDFCNLLAGHGP